MELYVSYFGEYQGYPNGLSATVLTANYENQHRSVMMSEEYVPTIYLDP